MQYITCFHFVLYDCVQFWNLPYCRLCIVMNINNYWKLHFYHSPLTDFFLSFFYSIPFFLVGEKALLCSVCSIKEGGGGGGGRLSLPQLLESQVWPLFQFPFGHQAGNVPPTQPGWSSPYTVTWPTPVLNHGIVCGASPAASPPSPPAPANWACETKYKLRQLYIDLPLYRPVVFAVSCSTACGWGWGVCVVRVSAPPPSPLLLGALMIRISRMWSSLGWWYICVLEEEGGV